MHTAHLICKGRTKKSECMWNRRNYIDFIQKHYKYENTVRSNAEGIKSPTNFNALDDGRVRRNM
jgi:hypothetical protein